MARKEEGILNTFLIIIYMFEIYLIFNSWQVYTSLFKWMPWYESCGMQFLVNYIFFIPLLVVIGLILLKLRNKIQIPKWNLRLPWISILAIGLPTINGGLSRFQIITGSIIVLFVFILSLYLNIKHTLMILNLSFRSK